MILDELVNGRALVADVEANDLRTRIFAGVLGHGSVSLRFRPGMVTGLPFLTPTETRVSVLGPQMVAGPVERPFRVHERKAVRFVVEMSHPIGGWQAQAGVRDIGLGGAGLEIAAPGLEVGDRVILSFIAPTLWDPLEIPARVAWVQTASRHARHADLAPTRFGVAFEPTDAAKVLALFELVSAFIFDR